VSGTSRASHAERVIERRQRPATYPCATGTDPAAIRFTAHADRPIRRCTYGSPSYGACARNGPEISGIACGSGSYLDPADFVRGVARATRLAILAALGTLALKAFRLTQSYTVRKLASIRMVLASPERRGARFDGVHLSVQERPACP